MMVSFDLFRGQGDTRNDRSSQSRRPTMAAMSLRRRSPEIAAGFQKPDSPRKNVAFQMFFSDGVRPYKRPWTDSRIMR